MNIVVELIVLQNECFYLFTAVNYFTIYNKLILYKAPRALEVQITFSHFLLIQNEFATTFQIT